MDLSNKWTFQVTHLPLSGKIVPLNYIVLFGTLEKINRKYFGKESVRKFPSLEIPKVFESMKKDLQKRPLQGRKKAFMLVFQDWVLSKQNSLLFICFFMFYVKQQEKSASTLQ